MKPHIFKFEGKWYVHYDAAKRGGMLCTVYAYGEFPTQADFDKRQYIVPRSCRVPT